MACLHGGPYYSPLDISHLVEHRRPPHYACPPCCLLVDELFNMKNPLGIYEMNCMEKGVKNERKTIRDTLLGQVFQQIRIKLLWADGMGFPPTDESVQIHDRRSYCNSLPFRSCLRRFPGASIRNSNHWFSGTG